MTPSNYGSTGRGRPRSLSAPAEPTEGSHAVELATLTLPTRETSPSSKNAAILHASREATEVLAADAASAVERGIEAGGTTSHIQAVIDLEKLSHLAHATDDEFVTGLHREAHDRTFNPEDSTSYLQDALLAGNNDEDGVEALLSTSVGSRKDVPLEILPFQDAVMDTEHLEIDDVMDDALTIATEEDVQVGHDAFLLELPHQEGEKPGEHHFVLAIPESHPDADTAGKSQLDEEDDDDHHHFPMLERAMTMMSAHLPTDIRDVQLEAKAIPVDQVTSELHLDLVIKRQVPLIGYIILFVGFFALASAGAAFELQGDLVSASMKTYWRLMSTSIIMFPIVVLNVYRDGLPKLSKKEWMLLPAAAFCYAQMTTVFVVALDFTSLANAFVFSNMTSLVIIVCKLLMGLPVMMLESSGALIGILGGIVCSKDSSAVSDGGDQTYPNEMLGNLIALSASFGTAAYLAIARDLRPKCDLYVYMFSIFFLSSFFVLAFMLVAGEPVEFSRNTNYGLFGWMNLAWDRLPLELFFAFIINGVGTMGYIAVLKYFDPIVVSVIMLMEPVAGVFIGVWVGVDTLPGTITWIGDAFVTLGSALVVYSGSKKTESIDATKAVRPRAGTFDIQHGKGGSKTSAIEMLNTPVGVKRPSPKKRME